MKKNEQRKAKYPIHSRWLTVSGAPVTVVAHIVSGVTVQGSRLNGEMHLSTIPWGKVDQRLRAA